MTRRIYDGEFARFRRWGKLAPSKFHAIKTYGYEDNRPYPKMIPYDLTLCGIAVSQFDLITSTIHDEPPIAQDAIVCKHCRAMSAKRKKGELVNT